jgi:hypothetical protein
MMLVDEVAFFHVVVFVRADVAATTPPGRTLCAEQNPARNPVDVIRAIGGLALLRLLRYRPTAKNIVPQLRSFLSLSIRLTIVLSTEG